MIPKADREKLPDLKLLTEFTPHELDAFFDLVEPMHVQAGKCIVRQDEPSEAMYILIEGEAIVRHHTQGRDFVLARMAPGDFFGELGLIDEGPRSADVEAKTDCTVLSTSQATIRALAGVYPAAAFKLLIAVGRVLVQRLRHGNQKYIDSLLVGTPEA